MFKAPIPGMSLTTEPKGRPWENPPQYDDVDEVIEYYVTKLSKENVVDDLVEMMDIGIPIYVIVTGITRLSVMSGIHTIDVSMLVAPFLHEYLKLLAKASGANYEDGLPTRDQAEREASSLKTRVSKALAEATPDEGSEIIQSTQEAINSGDTMVQQEETQTMSAAPKRSGLGGRKVTNV